MAQFDVSKSTGGDRVLVQQLHVTSCRVRGRHRYADSRESIAPHPCVSFTVHRFICT